MFSAIRTAPLGALSLVVAAALAACGGQWTPAAEAVAGKADDSKKQNAGDALPYALSFEGQLTGSKHIAVTARFDLEREADPDGERDIRKLSFAVRLDDGDGKTVELSSITESRWKEITDEWKQHPLWSHPTRGYTHDGKRTSFDLGAWFEIPDQVRETALYGLAPRAQWQLKLSCDQVAEGGAPQFERCHTTSGGFFGTNQSTDHEPLHALTANAVAKIEQLDTPAEE